MPYIVNFTDRENKLPITVFDNTSNTDTSLTFPGRNVSGYGQTIAENFLSLLENFAKSTPPVNPVEGQLWYDISDGVLKVWDNVTWKAASNIQKGVSEPSVEQASVGELWVDTTNQQLYIFSGNRWILVGPDFSSGLLSGPKVEQIIDSDNQSRVILTFYVQDVPLIVFSKDNFTPKIPIDGYSAIRSGLNITSLNVGTETFETKLYGRASSSDSLTISGVEIPAGRFLRSDVTNTTDFGLNVRNNAGITVGVDGNFSLTSSTTSAKIYNSSTGSSIDFQVNRGGIPTTTLRIIENTVGINIPSPTEALEVGGNILSTGSLILTNSTASTNLNNGTIRTAGGVSIGKNLIIGDGIDITGLTSTQNIVPKVTDIHDLGSVTRRWNVIRTKTLVADTIQGVLEGNISGNASTATNLRFVTNFRLEGDVTSPTIQFDGQVGGLSKVFNTSLTSGIISSKSEPSPNRSIRNDTILVFRPGTGLLKETRDAFLSDLAVPIGAILPYAGSQAPYGYLLCDGSEVQISRYSDLYDILGTTYNGSLPLVGVNTFRLPDLRGRFPLGRDNMDNGLTVPNSSGGLVDAGGGNIDRIGGTEPDTLGASSGQSTTVLTVNNLPNHEHDMRGSAGQQYFATRIDTAIPSDSGAFSDRGPTTIGQSQYLPSSGGIKTAGNLGQPFSVVNPFLTLNYIIRSGPPAF
jgi:microcystin-dependent protein